MANIEKLVERFTHEETITMLKACLENLPETEAIEYVKEWIQEHNLQAEFEDLGE